MGFVDVCVHKALCSVGGVENTPNPARVSHAASVRHW